MYELMNTLEDYLISGWLNMKYRHLIKKITLYDYKEGLKNKLFKKCQRSWKYLRLVPTLEKKSPEIMFYVLICIGHWYFLNLTIILKVEKAFLIMSMQPKNVGKWALYRYVWHFNNKLFFPDFVVSLVFVSFLFLTYVSLWFLILVNIHCNF